MCRIGFAGRMRKKNPFHNKISLKFKRRDGETERRRESVELFSSYFFNTDGTGMSLPTSSANRINTDETDLQKSLRRQI
jgi:hypothetical protein